MRIGLGKRALRTCRVTMKFAVTAAGILALAVMAEEKPSNQVLTSVSSTTLSGYVSTSAYLSAGPTPVLDVSFLGFTNGNAQVLLKVVSGRTNRVEVSTNLVTWEVVGTVAVPNPVGVNAVAASVSMTHSNASQLPCFYYRVVELP